jgi:hypothetical protein
MLSKVDKANTRVPRAGAENATENSNKVTTLTHVVALFAKLTLGDEDNALILIGV